MSYTGLMAIVYFVCRAPFMRFFDADPLVIQAGSNILLCAAAFQIFDAMSFTFAGALRGAGDTHWTAGITIALSLILFAPLSLGAVAFTNLESMGPWLAGTIYSICLGLSLWCRFAWGKWQEIDIFTVEGSEKSVVVPSQEVAG
jgi:Na+-driven multidrug efflux pump